MVDILRKFKRNMAKSETMSFYRNHRRKVYFLLTFALFMFLWTSKPPTSLQLIENGNLPSSVIVGTFPWYGGLTQTEKQVADRHLKDLGYEPAESHDFRSPYIITPAINPDITGLKFRPPPPSRRVHLISCVGCPEWMWDDNMSRNCDFKHCPHRNCAWDPKGRRANDADVVIFFTDETMKAPPPHRPMGQVWVAYSMEPPTDSNFMESPHFPSWRGAFNWTMGYRTDADLHRSYGPLAWRDRTTLLADRKYRSIARSKNRTAAIMISHCPIQSRRLEYVNELAKYTDVAIFGRCGPGTETCPRGSAACDEKLKGFKFYLAFENSFCQDYITEKGLLTSFQNFRSSFMIPVMRGGFDYDRYLPPNVLVNAAHFKSARDLGVYLTNLASDLGRYVDMMKEVDKLIGIGHFIDWCRICEKINTMTETKTIPDIGEWIYHKTCYPPVDDPMFRPVDPNLS